MRPSPCKAAPSFVRNSLKELNERVTVVKSPLHSQSQLVERCSRLILFHHKQPVSARSEEHTSELQSLRHLVCRLLLENRGRACSVVINGVSFRDKVAARAGSSQVDVRQGGTVVDNQLGELSCRLFHSTRETGGGRTLPRFVVAHS